MNDLFFAKVKWRLYLDHGLGTFNNWLTLKKDRLEREEVVKALRHPEIQEFAKVEISVCEARIQEIKDLLTEVGVE